MTHQPTTPVDLEIVTETDPPLPAPATTPDRRLLAKLQAAPCTVHGTWEMARAWRDMAVRAEEAKLYCQVMLGFELLALREAHGETRGQFAVRTGKVPFHSLAYTETGLGTTTICKLMAMSEAALPRLKKLPALVGFDPATQPLGELPEPQREALSSAVRKLTDGLTQADFMVELGLAKAPQGSGAKGGHHPRTTPEPSVDEQAAAERKLAERDFVDVKRALGTYPERFTLQDDAAVMAEIAVLDLAAKARRQWLAQPAGRRDPRVVTALFEAFMRGH